VGSCRGVPQAVPTEHNPVHSGDKILNVSVAENSKTICLFNSINCRAKGVGGGGGGWGPPTGERKHVGDGRSEGNNC